MDLDLIIVNSIPLVAVIFGLVEFIKSFGVAGKALTAVSMLLGILFGLAYSFYTAGLPVGFAGWFSAVIFGLALGLVASGFYDFANSRWPKAP